MLIVTEYAALSIYAEYDSPCLNWGYHMLVLYISVKTSQSCWHDFPSSCYYVAAGTQGHNTVSSASRELATRRSQI